MINYSANLKFFLTRASTLKPCSFFLDHHHLQAVALDCSLDVIPHKHDKCLTFIAFSILSLLHLYELLLEWLHHWWHCILSILHGPRIFKNVAYKLIFIAIKFVYVGTQESRLKYFIPQKIILLRSTVWFAWKLVIKLATQYWDSHHKSSKARGVQKKFIQLSHTSNSCSIKVCRLIVKVLLPLKIVVITCLSRRVIVLVSALTLHSLFAVASKWSDLVGCTARRWTDAILVWLVITNRFTCKQRKQGLTFDHLRAAFMP